VQRSQSDNRTCRYKKWEWQLTHESLDRQAAFFNKVLHGPSAQDAASTDFWPRVRLHVTEKFYAGSWRNESTYPLARTVRTRYNLTADGGLESTNSAQEPHVAQFHAHNGSLTYTIKFPKPTEVTGSSRLHLLFAVDGEATDADIFVTLQKRDIEGNIVYFPYHTFVNEGHVAWGWLRASRRTLSERAFGDEIAHTHLAKDAQLLVPNKAVHLDINIQPTATHFRTGESLVLVIQGRDFGEFGPQCQVPRAGTGINEAVTHSVLLEGSFLELPIIPHHLSS
jgi:predicted acyl esterase